MVFTKAMSTAICLWHDRRDLWQDLKEDVRKSQPLILMFLLIVLACFMGARVKLNHDMQIQTAQEMRLDLERQEAIRASMIAAEQAKSAEVAAAARADREAVSRVLYGTALHHSEDAQKAVVWCIINRVESSLYPDTIQTVCEQESQWMGYSPENPIISSLYDVADEVITGWESGGYRAISPDYLYLTWERDAIVLRTTFTDGKNTHYWRVG